jgi:hypothetical protein
MKTSSLIALICSSAMIGVSTFHQTAVAQPAPQFNYIAETQAAASTSLEVASSGISLTDNLVVTKVGDKYGYTDGNGNQVIKARFDGADNFSHGLARVKVGKKWGFINEQGLMKIAPICDEAGNFNGMTALVRIGKQVGYIDKTGIQLGKTKYINTSRL